LAEGLALARWKKNLETGAGKRCHRPHFFKESLTDTDFPATQASVAFSTTLGCLKSVERERRFFPFLDDSGPVYSGVPQ